MRFLALLLSLFAASALMVPTPATADTGVVRFATLPDDSPGFPEGIAADSAGRIYVSTFNMGPGAVNVIHVFDRQGRLVRTFPVPGALPIGLVTDAADNLYVANIAGGNILKFTSFETGNAPNGVIQVCPDTNCGLNAMAFGPGGLLYVSDSFGGRVFQVNVAAGTATPYVTDELLKPAPAPHGFPPFGANGLAFDGNVLYIANTADDRILKHDPAASPQLTVLAESINGADGVVFDRKGRLWVAANQQDEVVALDKNTGRVLARVGAFEGIANDGGAKGFVFPASLVISQGFVYVTNLALPLPGAMFPESEVTTYTVSRFRLPN
jgi:sugar lactone lactonase YvrE